MLNNVMIVGRLKEIIKEEDKCEIKLAVTRSYKNSNGEYDIDIIPCTLWNGIAENICEYCKKGDIVGVKGRLQSVNDNVFVTAEKVTFLSSKKKEDE